jgi:hypothetical protein
VIYEWTGVAVKIILNVKAEASAGKTDHINHESGTAKGAVGKGKELIRHSESSGKLITCGTAGSV